MQSGDHPNADSLRTPMRRPPAEVDALLATEASVDEETDQHAHVSEIANV
jgi:hypothetical protein